MKILKRTLKIILTVFIALILVVAGILTWAFNNPSEAFKMAEKYVMPKDMKVTWTDMDIDVKHLSGINFYLNLDVTDLSIKKENPFIDVPVDKLHLETSIFPFSDAHKIEAHQWIIQAPKTLSFKGDSTKEKEPKEEQNPFQTFQGIIDLVGKYQKYVKMNNLDVDVEKFKLLQEDGNSIDILARLDQSQEVNPNALQYKSVVEMNSKNPLVIRTDGQIIFKTENTKNLALRGHLEVEGSGVKTNQELNLNYENETARIDLSGPVSYTKDKLGIRTSPKAELVMNEEGADLKIASNIIGVPGKNVQIKTFKLHVRSPFEKGLTISKKATDFDLSVPLHFYLVDKDMARPFEKACNCKVPETIQADISGKAWLALLMSKPENRTKVLDVNLKLEDVANKLISLNAAGKLQMDKQLDQFFYAPQIDSRATIHSFQGLRSFLDAKNILIPAPLDVLEGRIELVMKGPVESTNETYVFPAMTQIHLASKNQNVDIQTDATLKLNTDFKAAHLDVEALIRSLQLELPPLDPVRGVPRVTPDGRIMASQPQKKPSNFKFSMTAAIQTATPGAVRLMHEYFKPYLPITINVKQNQQKANSGFVSLEPFTVEYLRRQVQVEKMQINLSETNKKFFVVDGRLKIKQTQYTIFIDVLGPSNKPQITLSSDPYLPRSEIISVLIYDRTSDQLASTDAETAGNVEAAVVDRAVGLFGIWAFASTPIRGFSYNPSTKVYTATLALSDDVSASVGTNWEEAAQVELRKRVSEQWMLTAAWTPAGREQEEVTKLVLQWENRF